MMLHRYKYTFATPIAITIIMLMLMGELYKKMYAGIFPLSLLSADEMYASYW